ncbi:MAG: hypothetical protein SPL89_08780 [Clostridia bacterium]|nr:hypothetical protein [Clostridia bacterium]
MKKSFFENDRALLTVMVQADNPERIKELIGKSAPEGAEAFGACGLRKRCGCGIYPRQ